MIGERFYRLVVIGTAAQRDHRRAWRCQCDCGKETVVTERFLVSGSTKSCGCWRSACAKLIRTRHGMTASGNEHPLFVTWAGMVQRCTNPRNPTFPNYGGRGIEVYGPWRNVATFIRDIEALIGPRPTLKHSIDRIDTNGNYEPGNVRWATAKEQMANTRMNRRLTYRGEVIHLAELARRCGLTREALAARLRRGWSVEDAATVPVRSSAKSFLS
jgi:hypothetical protein